MQDNSFFDTAATVLLEPTGLETHHLETLLGRLCDVQGSDFADLYFQYAKHESWSLDEGVVKNGSFSIDKGASFGRR